MGSDFNQVEVMPVLDLYAMGSDRIVQGNVLDKVLAQRTGERELEFKDNVMRYKEELLEMGYEGEDKEQLEMEVDGDGGEGN